MINKEEAANILYSWKVEKVPTMFEKYQNSIERIEELQETIKELKEDLEIERNSLLKEGICPECGSYMQSRKVAVQTAMQPPEYEGFCPNCNFKEEEL